MSQNRTLIPSNNIQRPQRTKGIPTNEEEVPPNKQPAFPRSYRTKGRPRRTIFPERKIYRLKDLPLGSFFSIDLNFPSDNLIFPKVEGQLIYVNECRARVKLLDKTIKIGEDVELTQPHFVNMSCNTEVNKELAK